MDPKDKQKLDALWEWRIEMLSVLKMLRIAVTLLTAISLGLAVLAAASRGF